MNYYLNFKNTLKEIFGTSNIEISYETLRVDEKSFQIINDVIILESELLQKSDKVNKNFSTDVQKSFSHEWEVYSEILEDEHRKEFNMYFDIVPQEMIKDKRIADLGCGIGRWSYFLKDIAREIILVDFSNAIFIARKNLKNARNCLFFMADITRLPFKNDFADFTLSLGVLHHIPQDSLDEVKNITRYSKNTLIFLYYNLDNRPILWKFILKAVNLLRIILSKIKNYKIRIIITKILTFIFYLPPIYVGYLVDKIFKKGSIIPLYEFYHNKTTKRIEQDVYDRFFTPIEKRFSKKEITEKLSDHFSLIFSENLPYWHFLIIKK